MRKREIATTYDSISIQLFSHDEPLSESDVDEEQIRADRQAEEERRQQEQKQREIEMARLAELEEIAQQEQEAEIARQAAELAGNFCLNLAEIHSNCCTLCSKSSKKNR